MKPVNLVSLLFIISSLACSAQVAGKPNIVILFADDLGYADLVSYGNPYIRTSNLDRLAREGQRWADFYVAAPVCSPSRGALLTGQLSVRSGLYGVKLHVMLPQDSHGIPKRYVTLADGLKSAGYRTGMFGKWHLGDASENWPTRNGFDYWYGVPYSNDMDRVGAMDTDEVLHMIIEGHVNKVQAELQENHKLFGDPKSEYWNIPLYRSEKVVGKYDDELVERPLDQRTFTRRLTGEAIDFIRNNKDQPFFVYLPYSMPHLPVFASEDFAGKSLRGAYGDAVEEIDWSVGRTRATLEDLGIAGNTLVIFTSDNGPWQAVSTLRAGSAGVLRGSKATTWEGGVREPGIFWWPGKVEVAVISDIGSTMDIYATALSLAGVSVPPSTDGLDLTDTLLQAAPGPRIELPYYHRGHLKAFRKGNYKIVFYGGDKSDQEFEKPELYDLHQDIVEHENLAESRPDILADMMQAAAKQRAKITPAEPIFDMRLSEH